MKQEKLFEEGRRTILPSDPKVTPQEAPRLSRQSQAVLDFLRGGGAWNHELAHIAIRYSARIHDLRRAGYVIRIVERNHENGAVRYRLEGER